MRSRQHSAPRRRRKLLIALPLSILAAALAGLLTNPAGLFSPEREAFSLEYPRSWSAVDDSELSKLPSPPEAILRRSDGGGTIVIRRKGPFSGRLAPFANSLRDELRTRVPDVREVSARVVRVQAGNGFLYTYVRARRGTVHTILVVPAGDRSYTVSSTSAAGAASAETGRIIESFALSGRA